jgi:hypothetical protein
VAQLFGQCIIWEKRGFQHISLGPGIEGGPRAGVGSLSIKFSQKGPDAVCLCLCPSLAAERSTPGLSRLLLKSSFSDPHSHNKCNLPSHFGHIKRSQPATRTPKTLAITLSHFRGKCVKRSQFLCLNERTVAPFVIEFGRAVVSVQSFAREEFGRGRDWEVQISYWQMSYS